MTKGYVLDKKKQKFTEVDVISVGRKYITVESFREKFIKETGEMLTDYTKCPTSDFVFFEYKNRAELELKEIKIADIKRTDFLSFSIEQLNEILTYIQKVK